MNRFLILITFLLFPALSHASSWFKLEPGLEYRTIEIKKNADHPYVIHVFRINPRRFELRPMVAASPASVRHMVEATGAILGVNANFFDTAGKPLGLIIRRGQTVNSFKPVKWWGVFGVERSKPFIVHSNLYRYRQGITTAIEAGPRLIVKGVIPKLKSDASPRTAIGITKKGEVILLASHYPLQPTELARVMARPETQGGLGCVDALNFDGGSSTQLYTHVGSFELKLPSYLGVPVGLGVFRK